MTAQSYRTVLGPTCHQGEHCARAPAPVRSLVCRAPEPRQGRQRRNPAQALAPAEWARDDSHDDYLATCCHGFSKGLHP